MKKHLISISLKVLEIICAGVVLYCAWNEVVPELFHYKEITIVQSLWIACAVRVLIYK